MQIPVWFVGAVDFHVHTAPSLFQRRHDDLSLVRLAADYGMRAVVLKCHAGDTAARAAIVSQVVENVTVFGGVVLNRFVGGINPNAVRASLKMGGRVVWMPTMHAANHLAHYGGAGYTEQPGAPPLSPVEPVTVLDADGGLRSEVGAVLDVIADHPGTVLVNGHLDTHETLAVFRAARDRGITQLVVSHPHLHLSNFAVDAQHQFADLGAWIEHCYLPHTATWGAVPIARTAAAIRAVGVDRCFISTDLGQADQIDAPAGLLRFGELLSEAGFTDDELRRLVAGTPSALLGGNGDGSKS